MRHRALAHTIHTYRKFGPLVGEKLKQLEETPR